MQMPTQSSACESIVPALLITPPASVLKLTEFNAKPVPAATTNVRAKDANPDATIFPPGATNDVTPEPAITALPLHDNVPPTSSEPAPSRVPPLRPSVVT